MGQVYEVQHVELGRRAALKMLRSELAQDEAMAARFFTEARAMSLMQHPGLVQVYEYGHLDDGSAYIVMEYIEGESLREVLNRYGGKLSAILTTVLGRQMAAALLSAHDKGVVHRDLKPENIKIVADDDSSIEGRVKILDFGIAKMLDAADAQRLQTRPGQILGTPTYLAPEQAGAPGDIGPHSDVYALGVMLFEMLSGQPPFTAEDGVQLIGKHLFAEPPRLSALLSNADPELDALLHRMLAKKPEARPSMREVKAQLGKLNRRSAGADNANDSASSAETMVLRRSQPTITTGSTQSWLRRLRHLVVPKLPRPKADHPAQPEDQADSQAETHVLRRGTSSTVSAFLRLRLKQLSSVSWPQKILFLIIVVLLIALFLIGAWAIFRSITNSADPTERPAAQDLPERGSDPQQPGATRSVSSDQRSGSSDTRRSPTNEESQGGARLRRKESSSSLRKSSSSSSVSKPSEEWKAQSDEVPNGKPRIVD